MYKAGFQRELLLKSRPCMRRQLSEMTELCTKSELSLLRRTAASGSVRVAAQEKATLDRLVAAQLIVRNRLTVAGWRELREVDRDVWLD